MNNRLIGFALGVTRSLAQWRWIAVLLFAACTVSTPASGTLYGISFSYPRPASLYVIDVATGVATFATKMIGADHTAFAGLAARNGTLYTTDVVVPPTGLPSHLSFGSIDPTTGMFVEISDQAGCFNCYALAYDPNSDTFYTENLDSANQQLVSITPAGIFATVGITNRFITGLGFDSNTETLYGVDTETLYSIDIGTGTAVAIGPTGIESNFVTGLAFELNADTLYMNTGAVGNGSLYRLNTQTGEATLVGANVNVPSFGLGGIAIIQQSVPEPATLALVGLGLAGLGFSRRKH